MAQHLGNYPQVIEHVKRCIFCLINIHSEMLSSQYIYKNETMDLTSQESTGVAKESKGNQKFSTWSSWDNTWNGLRRLSKEVGMRLIR